ncbi:MAG: OB-fold nucleic acid binding domain-containing protein, partial [Ferruginibacter sp.]
MGIFTFKDLLEHFPFRHIDKTKVEKINSVNPDNEFVQVAGRLKHFEILGEKRGKRLVAYLEDDTGEIELLWFQGINWVEKTLTIGASYLVFGRLGFFMGKPQIAHPEMELYSKENATGKNFLEPVYTSTEKLSARTGFSGRNIAKLTKALILQLEEKDIPENLPESLLSQYKFVSRFTGFQQIHFPSTEENYQQALRRLKFEELFFSQLRLSMIRGERHQFSRGVTFKKVGDLFNGFFNNYLPFNLTGAQKRVLKEIRNDTGSGR